MLLTKFGKNAIKHVEEEADCEKKKERTRNAVPFARARAKLGGMWKRRLIGTGYAYFNVVSHPATVHAQFDMLKECQNYDLAPVTPNDFQLTSWSIIKIIIKNFGTIGVFLKIWPLTTLWPINNLEWITKYF